MASSQSLLGLVNQLQNIELTFTTILMESAMKLSALTDANIFVLVESQDGRRYCGKRHLCDAYASSGLSPIGNDVEMEVNPTISALQERRNGRPFHPHDPRMHQPGVSISMENLLTSPQTPRGRKRTSTYPSHAGASKQSRHHHHHPYNRHPQPQHRQPRDPDDTGGAVVVVDVKQEAPSLAPPIDGDQNLDANRNNAVAPPTTTAAPRKTLESDDSDFAEIVEELPLNSIEKSLNRMTAGDALQGLELMQSGNYDDFPDVTWQPTNGSPFLYQNDSCSDLSASEQDKVYDRFLGRLAEDGRRKIEAIQSFGEDKILFVKGSAPQKILSSLCYSLGKAVTEECIEYGQVDPKSHFPKQLFVILIDRFLLDHFPQLIHAYAKLRHEIKKTFFSVLNKVKNRRL